MTVMTPHLLVIGVGPGIGAAVARRFAREGFMVTLVARRSTTIAPLAAELRHAGSTAHEVIADATNIETFKAALVEAGQQAPFTALVYNAAHVAKDSLLTATPSELTDAHLVNVVGAVVAAQVVAPSMQEAGQGTVLFTSGGYAVSPSSAFGSLSIGKTALRAATVVFDQELNPAGIHVATVRVDAKVAADSPVTSERVAEAFWATHAQPRDQWTTETVVSANDLTT